MIDETSNIDNIPEPNAEPDYLAHICSEIIPDCCNPNYTTMKNDFRRLHTLHIDGEAISIPDPGLERFSGHSIFALYKERIEDPIIAKHIALNAHQGSFHSFAHSLKALIDKKLPADWQEKYKASKIEVAIDFIPETHIYKYTVTQQYHPDENNVDTVPEELFKLSFDIKHNKDTITHNNAVFAFGEAFADADKNFLKIIEKEINDNIAGKIRTYAVSEANKTNLAEEFRDNTTHDFSVNGFYTHVKEENNDDISFIFYGAKTKFSKSYFLFLSLKNHLQHNSHVTIDESGSYPKITIKSQLLERFGRLLEEKISSITSALKAADEIVEKSDGPDANQANIDIYRFQLFINKHSVNNSKKFIEQYGLLSPYTSIENEPIAEHLALNNHQNALQGGLQVIFNWCQEEITKKMAAAQSTDQKLYEDLSKNFQLLKENAENPVIYIDEINNNKYSYTATVKSPDSNQPLFNISCVIEYHPENNTITHTDFSLKFGESANTYLGKNFTLLTERMFNQSFKGKGKTCTPLPEESKNQQLAMAYYKFPRKRADIDRNGKLFNIFESTIDTNSSENKALIDHIIKDLKNKPSFIDTLLLTETYHKNKIAEDFIKSLSLKSLNKLIEKSSPEEVPYILKAALNKQPTKLVALFTHDSNFVPNNKFRTELTNLHKNNKPSFIERIFEPSKARNYDNAKLLLSKKYHFLDAPRPSPANIGILTVAVEPPSQVKEDVTALISEITTAEQVIQKAPEDSVTSQHETAKFSPNPIGREVHLSPSIALE